MKKLTAIKPEAQPALQTDQVIQSQAQAAASEDMGGRYAEPYLLDIRDRIDSALVYPTAMRARGLSGSVVLRLKLERSGHLASAEVLKSSGIADIDELALRAVRDAAPFAPMNLEANQTQISLNVPIELKIRR